MFEDDGGAVVAETRVVGQRVNDCRQRRHDLGSLDHEEINSEVDAAALRGAVEEGRVAVEDAVLVVTADAHRDLRGRDSCEQKLGESGDVVDIEVGEFGVGRGEIEDLEPPRAKIEGHDRGEDFPMRLEGGGNPNYLHGVIVT